MRILGVIVAIVIVGLVFAGAVLLWPAQPLRTVTAAAQSPQLIAQGRYVATAADCIACHTVPGGEPFGGGRAFTLPFGTIYSPNITPDREHGIGTWTDAQFVRAIKAGVGHNGEELYPALPYTSYHRMSDADALAVKAYLFSLPPAATPSRPNNLAFPFNQRPLMRFWKLLFMPRHEFAADPRQSAQWNRGAYLVTAVAHCGECHTPRNLMYGVDNGRALAGETVQGWTAWNITSDPHHGLGGRGPDAVVAYLHYGYAPGIGAAGGPMKEAIDYSLSQLSTADLQAIAVYLASVRPQASGPLEGVVPQAVANSSPAWPSAGDPHTNAIGKRVFQGACAGCHAWNGKGQVTPLADLAGLRSVNHPKGLNVMQTILHGNSVSAPQGRAAMPAFAAGYSDAEIAALTNYVVGRFGGQNGSARPADVAKARMQ
ncbi:MAG: c-type cytochrome [Caulobacteraceae bacterium]|nr:c-type cytochrome [Caulobacteraceae bacterium]